MKKNLLLRCKYRSVIALLFLLVSCSDGLVELHSSEDKALIFYNSTKKINIDRLGYLERTIYPVENRLFFSKKNITLLNELLSLYRYTNPQKALVYKDALLSVAPPKNVSHQVQMSLVLLGHIYQDLDDYINADEMYYQAIEMSENKKNTLIYLLNIGELYMKLGANQVSINHFKELLASLDSKELYARQYTNVMLAKCYVSLANYPVAKSYVNIIEAEIENPVLLKEEKKILQRELLQIYIKSNSVKKANFLLEQTTFEFTSAPFLLLKAELCIKNNKRTDAIKLYQEIIEQSGNLPIVGIKERITAYFRLAKLLQKDVEKSFFYSEEGLRLSIRHGFSKLTLLLSQLVIDQIIFLDKKELLAPAFMSFKSASLLQNDNMTLQTIELGESVHIEEKLKMELKFWYFISFLTLIAILVVIVTRYNYVKKTKKIILEQNQKLHDNEVSRLNAEVKVQEQQLLNNTLLEIEKKNLMQKIIQELDGLGHSKLSKQIKQSIIIENKKNHFNQLFSKVHPNFIKNLKIHAASLTDRQLELCVFVKLGINTKEIASLTNLTPAYIEVSRSSIRKKLNIDKGVSIQNYFLSIEGL